MRSFNSNEYNRGWKLNRLALLITGISPALSLCLICLFSTAAAGKTLSTEFDTSVSGQQGLFFDVTTNSNAVYVSGFDLNMVASGNVTLYTRDGTSQGFEDSADGWSEIGDTFVEADNGIANVPLGGIVIPANTTQGFLLLSSAALQYNTLGPDNSVFRNDDITIESIRSNTGATPFTGGSARVFSGSVHYSIDVATLTTPADDSFEGIFFDITANDSAIFLRGLETVISGEGAMRLMYKRGTYKGSETAEEDWAELAMPEVSGVDTELTPLPLPGLVIPKGETYGFFLYSPDTGDVTLHYDGDTGATQTLFEFTDFTLMSDTASNIAFTDTIADRALTGNIYYDTVFLLSTPASAASDAFASGFFLDITAKGRDVRVEGFASDITEDINATIYYKSGTYVGSEWSPGDWNLFSTSEVAGTGLKQLSEIPGSGITIPAGETVGIYILADCDNCQSYFGFGEGEEVFGNASLTVRGNTSAFRGSNGFDGTKFSPRAWRGAIRYSVGDESSCFIGVAANGNAFTFCL